MLAGNVTAAVRGGTLFVTGDNLDNAVVIQQTGTNQFAVVGATDSGTMVNGKPVGTVFAGSKVRNFEIDLRGGNDSLGISNNSDYLTALNAELLGGPVTGPGVAADALHLAGHANIRGGTGNDAIAVQLVAGGAIFVDANAGSDAVVVEGSTAASLFVSADTGNQRTDGADYVRIRNVAIAKGVITVNTWAGNDRVDLADDSALTIIVDTGVGATISGVTDVETVNAARLNARHDVLIFGGAGNDSQNMNDVTAHFLLVVGGSGDDHISVGRLRLGSASLIGENGDDSILIDDSLNVEDPATPIVVTVDNISKVTGLMHIDAGAGNDTVNVNGNDPISMDFGSLNVWTFGGNDTIILFYVNVARNVSVDAGSGNDSLLLDTVIAGGNINAYLLDGNDSVTMMDSSAAGSGHARFFGGLGADSFTDGGGNGTKGVDYFLFDFETLLP